MDDSDNQTPEEGLNEIPSTNNDENPGELNESSGNLQELEIFNEYYDKLESIGISTLIDFFAYAIENTESILEFLDMDQETLNKLIEFAKGSLSPEIIKEIESSEIKEIGVDYQLGARIEGEEDE